jgi:flagellar biosynthesis protein FlhB
VAENENERSKEDLTEDASPYRLEEFRRKGQVAQSKEVSSLAVLLAASITAYAMAPTLGTQLADFMRETFRTDLSARMDLGSPEMMKQTLLGALKVLVAIGLPISVAGFVLGIAASFAQVGSIFSSDPISPDLSRIDPIQGFKRIFSTKQLVEGLKISIKLVLILLVAYALLKTELLQVPASLGDEPMTMLWRHGKVAKVVFLSLAGVLGVFAAIDYGFQKWEFTKKVRMTKQEAKQEHKEREGDPMIKARIRAVQREMARRRMMQAVKKADVIVTNPTHIAVALVYDKNKMLAPKVVAKGADFIAQKIKKVAAEAGIPMVENVPLARALYKSVKMGQYVPRTLYQAVAEVLAYVYRLKHRGLN